jgi:hypothetical protein
MSNEITPTDSACPVYIQKMSAEQIAADKAQTEAQVKAFETKIVARQAVLDKLGLTADEAAALFG